MPRTPAQGRRFRRQQLADQVADDMQMLATQANASEKESLYKDFSDNESAEKETSGKQTSEKQTVEKQTVEKQTAERESSEKEPSEIVAHTEVRWRAGSGEYETTCQLFNTNDESLMCPIMHEPTCCALVDDLPATWPLQDSTCANTVRLQCSHSFYVPALVFHFLAADMRCPVCRAGGAFRMDIVSVPLSVRHLYADKLNALHQRTLEQDIEGNLESVNIAAVLCELELEMRLFGVDEHMPWSSHTSPHQHTTARTRVIFDQQHIQDIEGSILAVASDNATLDGRDTPRDTPMTSNFAVHRSFQRLIRSMVGRQYLLNPGARIHFALTHPLLPMSFRSHDLSIEQAWTCHFTPNAPPEACIPLFCANVGGTQPLALIRTVYCSTTNTTSITVDVNIHMIINISSYVNDVLESIRESVRQHTTLNLPLIETMDIESFPSLLQPHMA